MLSLAAMLTLTGCDRLVDGRAGGPARNADLAYFFAGDVGVFGQTVSATDKSVLAYLRALRRIDVCGLLTRDAMAKVGELVSVATMFTFNECDMEIKLAGASGHKLVSVELVMTRSPGNVVAFWIGDTPVYKTIPGGCQYLVPLDLSTLPGAGPLHKPEQPFVRIGLIADEDCGLAERITDALAQRMRIAPLPARDGAAVYPSPLAERDPCEVLGVIGADVEHWDIDAAQPHECQFGVWHAGLGHAVSIQLQLQPKLVDTATAGRERSQRDGVEVYIDRTFCSALSFVGPKMQRRIVGAGYVDVPGIEVRPAVVATSGGNNCEVAADVTARAAKLYG
jgi:hypothetical protein